MYRFARDDAAVFPLNFAECPNLTIIFQESVMASEGAPF